MKKILVLCTGNSCRSQMAEGFLRSFGVEAESAGIESHGLSPYIVKVMRELNIDISKNYSKKIDNFDIIITVCDYAKETCPHLSNVKKIIHKSFRNPADYIGIESEKLIVYRKVRDEIGVFCKKIFYQYYGEK